MSPTLTYRLLRWLLPLLVARAFVPVGFMLSADAQGLALTLCPSVFALPGGQQAQLHDAGASSHEHDQHHEHEQHHKGGSSNSLCPFALVGGACSVEVAHVAATVDRPSFAPVPFESASIATNPLRAERIRGPPIVS